MGLVLRLALAQAGVKGCFGDEVSGARVIGMPLIGPWREDDFGTPLPDHVDDLQLFFAARSQTAVAEVELFAERGAEDLCGCSRFAESDLSRAARAHL